MRKAIKYTSYLLLGLILAIIVFPFIFKDELKEAVKDALNESLNAEITFTDIGLNFWKDFPNAHLQVENLNINGLDTFKNINLFNAAEIHIEIGLASIIKKNTPYSIRSLEINNAKLNLQQLADGQVNYLITKPTEDTIVYNIDLTSYSISNSSLFYRDFATDLVIEINNLIHRGSGNLTQDLYDLNTFTQSEDFNLKYEGIPYVSKGNISAEAIIAINLPSNKYTFKDNKFWLNAFPFSIDGYTQLFDDYIDLDFNLNADKADFAKLYSLVPMAYTTDFKSATIIGNGNISGFLKGSYSADKGSLPDFSLIIDVNEGQIKYDRLPYPIENINTNISITFDGAKSENINISIPQFGFDIQSDHVKGHYKSSGLIQNPNIDFGIDAKFDLATWKNSLPLSSSSILSGRGKIEISLLADLKAIQENRFDKINFKSDSYIDNLLMNLPDFPVIKAEKITINGDPKKFNATAFNLIYGDSDFSFDLSLINPLQIIIDKTLAQGKLVLNSKRINLNSLIQDNASQDNASSSNIPGLFGQFEIEANVNEIVFEDKIYRFNQLQAKSNQDNITINAITSQVGDSDFTAQGQLTNINNFINDSGALSGDIDIRSKKFDVDPWLVDSEQPQDTIFILPKNTEIDIKLQVEELIYKGLKMNSINAIGTLFNQSLQISEAKSNSLGGQFVFQGLYATPENSNPLFDFKIDLESILFQKAFKELNTFQAIAPIAQYISGKFNTTLVMSGSLNDKMMPVWNNLDASGYLETLDSKIQGFEAASTLASKLGIEKLKIWNIGNTKNWFEIVDGMVQLKENTFNLGDGIMLTIAGRHGIGSVMDYDIYLEIPRVLLQQNQLTATADKGLVFLENAASKIGINLEQGENILIKIDLTGKLSSPQLQIKPVGTTGKGVDQQFQDQIKNEKEKVEEKIKNERDKLKDTIQQKKTQVIDSLKERINQKSNSAIDTLKSKAVSKLDSLINKTLSDSTSSPLQEVLKEKSQAEKDKLKSVLDKWSPMKKKVTKDTTKNN